LPANISAFFDPDTATVSYILADPATRQAAVIDSVLDYDAPSGRTDRRSVDKLIAHLREHDLALQWILETHVHADHLSAAPLLRQELGGMIGIGSHIPDVQRFMAPVFGTELPERQPFDRLFEDEERFHVGGIEVRVLHTPGHTPACCTYVAAGAAFVGDTLFMPDFGTARCDFPGGDAHAMYRSIRRILDLPPETRIFVGHDYPGDRREAAWESTVAEQRARNKHVHDGVDEADFVEMRTARDKTLKLPTHIIPSVQCNIRAGQLPEADEKGRRYLKVPIDTL
jgi:glyoxylase-like metal-dependent hydrolase (beta-lactamase superfamily II)